MATVTVQEQGAWVRRRSERLVITKEQQVLDEVQLIHLDQLVLVGNVNLTMPALTLLIHHKIPVILLTRYGRLRVRIDPSSETIQLRMMQMRRFSDEMAALHIARAAVVGKLTNQRTLLQRQATDARGPLAAALTTSIAVIARMIEGAQRALDLEQLRGFEGNGAAAYWEAWRAILPAASGFKGRQFRPAPDPVNALLSFGYTLLTKDMTTAVGLVGLDPFLGFFHAIEDGRASLPLDLIEEFRPILVDGMVLEMLHRNQMTPQSFEWTGNPQRPVQLTDEARDRFHRAYEARLTARVTHPVEGRETSYRRCLELQARQIARYVLGEVAGYVPMVIR